MDALVLELDGGFTMNAYYNWLWNTTLRGILQLQCYAIGENSMIKVEQLQKVWFMFPIHSSPIRLNLDAVYPGPFDLIGMYGIIGMIPKTVKDYVKTIHGLELSFQRVVKRWQA